MDGQKEVREHANDKARKFSPVSRLMHKMCVIMPHLTAFEASTAWRAELDIQLTIHPDM